MDAHLPYSLIKHNQTVTQPILRRRSLGLICSDDQVVANGRGDALAERPVFVLRDNGLRRLCDGIDYRPVSSAQTTHIVSLIRTLLVRLIGTIAIERHHAAARVRAAATVCAREERLAIAVEH